jgi:hypothetical protein
MTRLFLSTVIGILAGIGLGLLIGWQIAPVEYINSPMSDLAQRHKDDYTLMIASGYLADGDVSGAIDRLRALGVENVPAYVQETTERFITNSRDINEIRKLVALSEGLGRLTPPMENFRQLSISGTQTP